MDMIMQRDIIITAGAYKTVKSIPSSMDDPSTYALEYG